MKRLILALVVALLVSSCATSDFKYEQVDNMLGLKWERVDNAVFYEIQANTLEYGWFMLGITTEDRQLLTDIPVGVHRFRVRAWLLDGSKRDLGETDPVVVPPLFFEAQPDTIPNRDKVDANS